MDQAKPGTKRSLTAVALAAILAGGTMLAWWLADRADRDLREDLLGQTRAVAGAVNIECIKALTGTEADLEYSNYRRLKEQLAAVRAADPKCRVVYLMGRRADGTVFFFADSEPAGSEDESPVGQVYEEVPEAYLRPFDTNTALATGPVTDRWGEWVSAVVPLTDPQTDRLIAVLGMDIDARHWKWEVAAHVAIPVGLVLLAMIGLVAALFALGRDDQADPAANTADGRTVWFSTNGIPQLNADETLHGYRGSDTDISDRKRAEEAANRASVRLSLATKAGGVGVWEFDIVNNRLDWDDQMYALYGIGRETFGGAYESWRAGVHPEDIARGDGEVEMALCGEKEFDTEFRVVWPDGTMRHIRALAMVLRDADGKPLRMIGTNWDITEQKHREEALRASERKLQSIIQGSPIATFVIGRDHRILHWNRALEKLSGIPAHKVLGTNDQWRAFYPAGPRPCLADIVVDQDPDALEALYAGKHRQSSLAESAYETTDFFPALSGGGRWLKITVAPICDAEGALVGATEMLEDITERKQAEEALRESERRFKDVLYASDDAILLIGDSTFIDCNEATARMLGHATREESLQTHPSQLSPPKQPDGRRSFEKAEEMMRLAFERGFHRFEWIHRRANGKDFPVEVSLTPIVHEGRSLLYCVWRDITEIKRAEEALRKSEKRFRTLFENSTDAYVLLVDGILTDCNQAMLRTMRCTREEFIGRSPIEFSPEFQPDGLRSEEKAAILIREALETGSKSFEWMHRRPDQTVFWAEVVATALMIDAKPVLFGSWRDITARKQAEEALHEEAQRFITLGKVSNTGVWEWHHASGFLWCSPEYFAMLGRDAADFDLSGRPNLKETWLDLLHPDDREWADKHFADYLAAGSPGMYEGYFRLRHRDGSWVWIWSRGSTLRDASGQLTDKTLGTHIDITERKRAEEALRENESRLRAITESAQDAILMMDPQGAISYWNPAAETILGYRAEEAIGRNLHELLAPAQFLEAHRAVFPDFSTTGRGDAVGKMAELAARRKDGQEITIALSLSTVSLNSEWHAVGILRDITVRKRTEAELLKTNRLLREATARANEMSLRAEQANIAKSEFLANMSHEIRTPMTAILGFAEVLRAEGDLARAPKQRLEAIQTIQQNGDYLLQLINDILDLSKIEAGELDVDRSVCSPGQLLAEVATLMRVRSAAKNIPLELEHAGGIPEVIRCDPLRLRQILINLVGNAIKFTETGSVRVVARLVQRLGKPALLQVDVIDTGLGITPQQTTRIFQPFSQADSSTTRKFGGTGLGLTISKRLAERLGGDITFSSTPGKGSTFTVTVETGDLEGVRLLDSPLEGALRARTEPADNRAPGVRLDGRILLAEDCADNQRLIAFVLKKAGAQVNVAENGQIALDEALAARDRGEPFDLILMDMQMPVMDGYTATAKLREAGYTGPIIAFTAHAMEGDDAKCRDAGCDGYLTKPIDWAVFLPAVAERLKHDTHLSQESVTCKS